MMERDQRSRHGGFTLLEIMIALVIFTVALGVVAQGLAYAYGIVTLQNQRVIASNDCRAVISALRQVAVTHPDTTACPANENKFPCVLLDWRSRFPQNADAVETLSEAERRPFAGMYALPEETITIDLTNPQGQPAVNGATASASTNPVHVGVTVQWRGPRGILYRESVRTAITDR